MVNIQFKLKQHASLENAWDELQQDSRVDLLYAVEDDTTGKNIYGFTPKPEEYLASIPLFNTIEKIEFVAPIETDWNAQWAEHAPGFNSVLGVVELNLSDFFQQRDLPTLQLKPGPGFGDLSHPTTRLVMELMKDNVKGKNVVDVGSGSGILSLCAIALGAKDVLGIDIDPDANLHARENTELNHMKNVIRFVEPEELEGDFFKEKPLFLMNMIRSEQKVAWASVMAFKPGGEVITSGILTEERDVYLKQCFEWGWKLLEEKQDGEWLAFRFLIVPTSA